MNRSFNLLCLAALGLILAGCAHTHEVQGPEPRSEIPEGIRVAIGGKEIAEGEKVNVLRSVCKTRAGGRRGSGKSCQDQKVGEALVLKVLDHDSAIVRPNEGLTMDSSMTVEKQ